MMRELKDRLQNMTKTTSCRKTTKHELKAFTKPRNLAGETSVAEPETMKHRLKVTEKVWLLEKQTVAESKTDDA
jgi:hypothetical protein